MNKVLLSTLISGLLATSPLMATVARADDKAPEAKKEDAAKPAKAGKKMKKKKGEMESCQGKDGCGKEKEKCKAKGNCGEKHEKKHGKKKGDDAAPAAAEKPAGEAEKK